MILVGNGRVITWNKEQPYFENGAVVIDGQTIADVGKFSEIKKKYKDVEFIDAEGKVIMPGFINAHNHIYSAFARGLAIPGNNPHDFLEILEGTWWKIDRNLQLQHTYYSALTTYMECIRNGVTSVVDHHASYGAIKGSLEQIAKAATKLGVRTSLCYEISDRDGHDKMKEAVEENFDFLNKIAESPSDMLSGLIGLHASFTLSDETLNYCRKQNKNRFGYHVHISEGIHDEIVTQRNYHMSVVERLASQGILGENTLAGHGVHISTKDMEILRQTHTTVIHNPESNMANAVGVPDILNMIDKGILVGLGTDGYTQDMLESLKVANILTKHRSMKPNMGFLQTANMCFDNNPKIASKQFGAKVGRIEKDAKADLIVIDYVPYTPMDENNLFGHVMFGISGSMTDTTIINGKIIMKDRKIISVDEEKIKKESREYASELWKTLI